MATVGAKGLTHHSSPSFTPQLHQGYSSSSTHLTFRLCREVRDGIWLLKRVPQETI